MRAVALPALVLSAAVGTWALLKLGLPVLPILAAGGVFYAGLVMGLERLIPYSPDWRHSQGDLGTDMLHLAITGGLVESAPALVLAPASLSLWPAQWPLAAQILLALLLTELLDYWVHRLMHGPLWRFHAVHHSVRRLYWMNSWRVHPVEGLTYCLFTVVPLLVLGAPAVPLTIVWAFSTVFRMLQHSNVDARLGSLNWVFSGPELHRWHHARQRSEQLNYGNVLAVWDVFFKTRRLPDAPLLEVGLDGETYPTTYAAQLLEPFRASRR